MKDAPRRKRRLKKKLIDLYAVSNAEERRDRAVPATEVQRREVVNQEENERNDDAVAENQQVENREKGQTVESEMSFMQVGIQDEKEKEKEDVKHIGNESQDVKESGDTQAVSEMIPEENQVIDQEVGGVVQEKHDQENGGKIVLICSNKNQVEIETINQENRAANNQEAKESSPVDNRDTNVISDEENQADNQEGNKKNQGVIEARGVIEVVEENKVDGQENKVETKEPLPATFQVNEPELLENQYLYVGKDDWPMTWNYEEQMVWGLGLGFSPNPKIEYICGIGWVDKNFID